MQPLAMKPLRAVRNGLAAGCLMILVGLAGCGEQGPQVVRVRGVVLRNGQPVPNLTLNFKPHEGRPSWGMTDAEGRFDLEYTREQKGARVGKHTIWVKYQPNSLEQELEMQRGGFRAPGEIDAIVRKYGREESTPYRDVEILAATDNFELVLD